MSVPELEHYCGSWVIVRGDGTARAETFDRRTAEDCARMGYRVVTAAQWLASINGTATNEG